MLFQRLKTALSRRSPWAYVAITGLAGLTLVDLWRDHGGSGYLLLRGVLPNFLAVFALTYGFLLMKQPKRGLPVGRTTLWLDRWFFGLLALVGVGLVGWEFVQLLGNLVFDPLDIWATLVASVAAIPPYFLLRRFAVERSADLE